MVSNEESMNQTSSRNSRHLFQGGSFEEQVVAFATTETMIFANLDGVFDGRFYAAVEHRCAHGAVVAMQALQQGDKRGGIERLWYALKR